MNYHGVAKKKSRELFKFLGILKIHTLLGLLGLSGAVAGSDTSCQTFVDAQGIPHFRGDRDLNAIRCLGFAHARDRLVQMDFFRRVGQGRTAEVYGYSRIKTDFTMRMMGLEIQAKRLEQDLSPGQKVFFESYVAGVNAGRAEALRVGLAYRETGDPEPETWTVSDTLLVFLVQSFDQTRKGFEIDYGEFKSKKNNPGVPDAWFSAEGTPWLTTILKKGEYPTGVKKVSSGSADYRLEASDVLQSLPPLAEGSNSWIVAPKRSQSGYAWLANDPHLDLRNPAFWYWVHVEGDRLNTIGASLPGTPLIASGANEHMAWGLTNAYLDAADLYAVSDQELERQTSATQLNSERPWIWFKLWKNIQLPFFFKTFTRTAEGWPLLPLPGPEGKKLVLRWSGWDVTAKGLESLQDLAQSRSTQEFAKSLAKIELPSWNFVFADSNGKIGYRAIGKIPKRQEYPPVGVAEDTLTRLRQWSFLGPEEMPHIQDPARGWLVTANNQHWPRDSLLKGGRAYSHSFRAQRIEELLGQTLKHDLDSMRQIQCDNKAQDAQYFVPLLLPYLDLQQSREVHVKRLLDKWDYHTSLDCRACGIYRRWMDLLMEQAMVQEPVLYRVLLALAPGGQASVSDPALGFLNRDWIRARLVQALDELDFPRDAMEKKIEPPVWGSIHRAPFAHISDRWSWGSGVDLATPGDQHSVSPGTAKWRESESGGSFYAHTGGASQRLVVELRAPPRVYAILPGLRSEHQARDKATVESQLKRWRACELDRRVFPVDWAHQKVETILLNN